PGPFPSTYSATPVLALDVTLSTYTTIFIEREEGMGLRPVQVHPVIICVLLGLLVFGCGGENGSKSGSSSTPTPPPQTNVLASALIRAADGGTVTVPAPHPLAGTAIAIPPGALATDTTISIAAAPVPTLPGVVGLAIDLQPEGTVFRVPVRVTL